RDDDEKLAEALGQRLRELIAHLSRVDLCAHDPVHPLERARVAEVFWWLMCRAQREVGVHAERQQTERGANPDRAQAEGAECKKSAREQRWKQEEGHQMMVGKTETDRERGRV